MSEIFNLPYPLDSPPKRSQARVKKKKALSALLLVLLTVSSIVAQDSIQPTPHFDKKKFIALTTTEATIYAASLVGLNETWYKQNARRSFHFFDDHAEWQQIDKLGHFYSTFHLSHASTQLYRWTGMPHRKAILLGSLTGILLMTPIEFFDGFSKDYGASWSDFLANSIGAAFALQSLWWQQPRINPKFSFHLTPFANLRPHMLGDNISQRMLKDYNGQTYWLALDIQPWLSEQSRFPPWLNLALGYGATNMIYAHKTLNQVNGYDTYRQYYLSLDINFTRIPVESKFVRSLFLILNTIHIPAPALEVNKKGMKFHPMYF
jgi:uncharacterized protein YfiM (DUF2279 family)